MSLKRPKIHGYNNRIDAIKQGILDDKSQQQIADD